MRDIAAVMIGVGGAAIMVVIIGIIVSAWAHGQPRDVAKPQDEKAEKEGPCVGYCMGPRLGFDGKIHLLPGLGVGL